MTKLAKVRRAVGSVKRPIDQAGGIVLRLDGQRPRVLIVTTRRRLDRWVLPKGSVKRGERARDAARREVEEEAGVRARVVGEAGIAEYWTLGGRVRIAYFLMEYKRAHPTRGEDRKIEWCAIEDAIAKLTYASARRVLLEAHQKITDLHRQRD